MMATPEKAILDLLYLYPQYKTEQDLLELRLDDDWMRDELDRDRLNNYLQRINSKALTQRTNKLLSLYPL